MKSVVHKTVYVLLWFGGAVFFFFLTIYIWLSFLTKGLRRLLKWKELYHFREEEFPALNVMNDSGKSISIGKLPVTMGEAVAYRVPVTAKEILLEFKFTSYPPDACMEFDYCLSANDASLRKEFIYVFINPFDSVRLNYDRVLLWYKVPKDGVLKVQFMDVKADNSIVKDVEGQLNVLQVR